MKLLIALIRQLMVEPENEVLEHLISNYSDSQINDACCFIRSQ